MSQFELKRRFEILSFEEVEKELEKVNPALKENNIILITVLNPIYCINVDIIVKVCKNIGKVMKIVIFERGQVVHALVEYKETESAVEAKKSLHGCNIYSDGCTLKVEFARQERLNVTRNDEMTWDFSDDKIITNKDREKQSRKVLLNEDPITDKLQSTPKNRMYEEPWYGERENGRNTTYNSGYEEKRRRSSQVLMVYNLDAERFNCKRLFNLLCLYGNIVRINFIRNKEGCAMVEFEDPEAAMEAAEKLNDCMIFGNIITLEESRKGYVEEIRNPYELPDGEKSFENFIGDKNNRFSTPKQAAKNRKVQPTKTLHFYNVPKMDDDSLMDVFTDQHAPFPTSVSWFETSSAKTFTGIVEFDTCEEASESLVIANNTEIENEDSNEKRPYIMKLCFSRN